MQNYLGSLPSRSRGFAGFGRPVRVAGPKVGILSSERDDPKGPQSKHKKKKRRCHDTFLNKEFWNHKSNENYSVWWFSLRAVLVTFGGDSARMPLYVQVCNSLTVSKNRARIIENGFLRRMLCFTTPIDKNAWSDRYLCGNSYDF